MQKVLAGYANFLREKGLALPQHQPYLARRVKACLVFAKGHVGYTFAQTLDLRQRPGATGKMDCGFVIAD